IPVRLYIVVDSYEVEDDTLSQAMNVIAKSIGNSYSDYFNKSNKREIVELRQIATFLLINFFPNITITLLGNKMKKHHTTIIHSRKVAQDRISSKDEIFMKKYYKARSELTNFITQTITNESL